MSPTTPDREGPAPTPRSGGSPASEEGVPIVVFVPGLGLDGRSWRLVRQELGRPSAVVLLPALGQRAPRGTKLSVERQAERLVDRLPTGEATIVVAHSASCPVAVQAAALTDDVVGLVLVGPVTDPAAHTWPRMVGQWARTATHERPREVPVLAPQYRDTGVLSMVRGMDEMRRFRTDRALGRLTVPVEIVRGAKDRIASAAWTLALQRASNRGGLATIQGAAHMVPLTHPSSVVAAVERVRHVGDQGE